ncbi:MAG: LysR substrate-binding domain-containing protein [Chitinophagaceae bacterium]
MTLTQLEYIIAIDNYRHFAQAAAHCHVTQPTLSAQVQKLEETLGVKIFDRSKQPVLPTEQGKLILQQARKIIAEKEVLLEHIAAQKGIIGGTLKLGIIPTLAPYLLPLFIPAFTQQYPDVTLIVHEYTTETLLVKLKEGAIDAGLLVTPLNDVAIKEDVLFYEELVAYVSKNHQAYQKEYVLAKDIDANQLWLLEEGHCFRSQIINLCELKRQHQQGGHFEYEAGSLETLRRMVERTGGITILPELATLDLSSRQQQHVKRFKQPAPVREVSLITHRDFVKKRLIEALKQQILQHIPAHLLTPKKKKIISL